MIKVQIIHILDKIILRNCHYRNFRIYLKQTYIFTTGISFSFVFFYSLFLDGYFLVFLQVGLLLQRFPAISVCPERCCLFWSFTATIDRTLLKICFEVFNPRFEIINPTRYDRNENISQRKSCNVTWTCFFFSKAT